MAESAPTLPGGAAGRALALLAALSLTVGNLNAGDILRGGAPAGDAARRADAISQATAAAAAAARANARDSLTRTTNALRSVAALQVAARAAAAAKGANNLGVNPNNPGAPLPNVPNGLATGGLQVDPGVAGGTAVWTGANLPTQSVSGGRTNVTIKQTNQTALLSWQTFNVGKKTTLRFDQSRGGDAANKWIAFNRVLDPSGAPSQILGSIQAPGQVYLINRNGIIFGGASQVNVGTLVASSLPINENLIDRGLLNNPDAQFLLSGIAIPAGANGMPAFTPDPPNPLTGRYGDVTVQRGARLTSPTNSAGVGGRIMLAGANVTNNGTIQTPDGQTILAAGLQVGIDAHSTNDPSLRGLDIYIGSVDQAGVSRYAGTATNRGLIEAKRGSVTIAGAEVNQLGGVDSSTTVSLNGRIDLIASYDAVSNTAYDATNPSLGPPFLNRQTGAVRFGPGSVTRVLPEYGNTETVIGTRLALNSQINATGRAIHLGAGSTVQAPSGDVTLRAGEWRFLGGSLPSSRFTRSVGQVYLDRDALIDVAGTTNVSVSLLQNILELELRGAEFANSPLQRDGILRGTSITVDIRNKGIYNGLAWVGTPIADATGFAALIERTIEEFTTPGGTVTISAGNSMVMQPGSKIDVSGGYINYQGAVVKTTRLLYQGRLIDIKDATPDRVYDGVYDGMTTVESPRWGVTETYAQPLALTGEHWEEGYIQGAAGGAIDITAPSMALDGELLGRTINGPRQREERTPFSSLRLAFLSQDVSYPSFPDFSPTPPLVEFTASPSQRSAGAFRLDAAGNPQSLRADRLAKVELSPDLLEEDGGGFGSLTIENPDGEIRIPGDITLETQPGGNLSMTGSNITVAGRLIAPGGNIALSAYNLPLDLLNALDNSATPVLPDPIAGRGRLIVEPGAVLSTAGLIVDERASSPDLLPVAIAGGSISLAGFDTTIGEDTLLDVSGGARMTPVGKVTYGDGGSLSIAGGRDLSVSAVIGGSLHLEGGTMQGYSGATGGSLRLTAPAFVIGAGSGNPSVISLEPEFFSTGGFASISLTGIGIPGENGALSIPGVRIAAGTDIRPVVEGWLAIPNTPWGKGLTLQPFTRPEGLRSPANLAFGATGATDPYTGVPIVVGDVVMERNTSIETDGLGSVAFSGQTVTIEGSVIAPGGSITVEGGASYPGSEFEPGVARTTVYIGREAFLSTAGKPVVYVDGRGNRVGAILPGGSISVSGNIVAERGAVFDVSGTTGILDLPPGFLTVDAGPIQGFRGTQFVPVRFDSDGGSITLEGSQFLYTDATFVGRPGGPAAIGGTLSVRSGRLTTPGQPYTSADPNLVVKQSGYILPNSPFPRGVGQQVLAANGAALPGIGNLAVSSFSGGGFNSLELGGNVQFDGRVSIELPGSIRVADGGVIYANNGVFLTAPYVALGQDFRPPPIDGDQISLFTSTDAAGITSPFYHFAPTWGRGSLTVRADLIDIGTLSLQGIGKASFLAPNGDIRGNGTLDIAGNLTLQAGQIYPTTLSEFNIYAYDYDPGSGTQPGSVTILGGAYRPMPLSAGGTLSIYASDITQGGTLRAPIGVINLGYNGVGDAPVDPIAGGVLAAPLTNNLTLTAGSVTSVAAVDPRTGEGLLIPFGISIDGNSWIDPAGNDITIAGLPTKAVNLRGSNVTTEAGSTIDIRGGGDLYAYRWIQGNGGTRDILDSSTSFAVIPGYGFNYAPYAPFNNSALATELQGAQGYVNNSLKVGDRVTLGASPGLPSGTYTLLPARYALLPGAFLVTPAAVTPQAGDPIGTFVMPDGSSLVSGYFSNDLDRSRIGRTSMIRLEIAPYTVTRQRAEYEDLFANTFLKQAALDRDFTPPRLPIDSGYLSFSALSTMSLRGAVDSVPPEGGRGALIDISSPLDIIINKTGTGGGAGNLVLSAAQLNGFNAESLLIGGLRSFGPDGAQVTVRTGSITVDNPGTPLMGSDIILAATNGIELTDGSSIVGAGSVSTLDPIFIGDSSVPGSGNGVLIRVSGNTIAPVFRSGVDDSTMPNLAVGANALLSGESLTLDSTYGTDLDPTARLIANTVTLNSGQISIQLDNPGTLLPTDGLVLSGQALESIQQSARDLTLGSYSTLDLYGTGDVGSSALSRLSLQASSIRGFNTTGGMVTFTASQLAIGNANDAPFSALPAGPLDGSLLFNAGQISLGDNDVHVENFATVEMNPQSRLLASGTGSFETAGDLAATTPVISGAGAANYRLAAAGDLSLSRPLGGGSGAGAGGLGATLMFEGNAVEINTDILAPSGQVTARATGGDLLIGNLATALIDVGGTSKTFLDVIRHTDGGTVNLASATGDVTIGVDGSVDVSGPNGGGNAGFLNVSAPNGAFTLAGSIDGSSGAGQRTGSFSLDAGSIAGNDLTAIDAQLNAGSFLESRDYRVRTGDLTVGDAASRIYRLAADSGSITVGGTIDASGQTGGSIDLIAAGNLTVLPGALLDASGLAFSSAGKGGDVSLTAGAAINGVADPGAILDLQTGSAIDLSGAGALPDSESRGQFTGTLHLRAPQNATLTDVQIAAIGSAIADPSSILVEGFRVYDRTGTGTLDNALLATIQADGDAFLGSAGTASANYNAMLSRLTSLQPSLDLILAPGVEIVNRTGSLTLGSTGSGTTSDWNLAGLRFGPRSAPGVLTLRASDNLTFYNAISDGFSGGTSLWLSPLVANNALLPDNTESWAYHFTAGSDLAAASYRKTLSTDVLAANAGLLELGKDTGNTITVGGSNATTASVIGNAFQVIRTGSGEIDLNVGRSLRLLNPFASIYTAGTQVADPTSVFAAGDFVVPITVSNLTQGSLGARQQNYPAQYSLAGGNVSIYAGENIERKTTNNSGPIDDSSRQLPNNWLYRRGYIGADGDYGLVRVGSGPIALTDPAASTSWWIDFSNFFEGVGALGGGDVSLKAGGDVKNVDAVIPTNARAAMGTPDTSNLLELGGGDLLVRTGNNIDGGVYFVERGTGRLEAGGEITTNATRSPSLGIIQNLNDPDAARLDPLTWLPTTLLVGKSSFDVSANGDLLLGPVTNAFMLPPGLNNRFWYKTYFNTYSPEASVEVSSLGGDVTLRNSTTLPDFAVARNILEVWIERQQILSQGPTGAAYYHPWLRLAETSLQPFLSLLPVQPPTLKATALAGDINIAGNLTLFPAPLGQLELVANGKLNALQPIGLSNVRIPGQTVNLWSASQINISDADPDSVPSPTTPFAYYSVVGSSANLNITTQNNFLANVANRFTESGSTTGRFAVSQTKQALHTAGLLHLNDPEPLRIYALGGDLSGLRLFSPKASRIFASNDITDISFYLQNLSETDATVVTAGRDVTAYDAASPLRIASLLEGNALSFSERPLAGDIHIGGPGSLQVLAGRDVDLGTGSNNPDGTGTGIVSVGNIRNPFLPFGGASLYVGAGIGSGSSLSESKIDIQNFIDQFVNGGDGESYLAELEIDNFDSLSAEQQAQIALEVFFRMLRDAGRNFNDPASAGFGNYDSGFAAIDALFGQGGREGEILARSRDIRTRSGGNIGLFAPSGGLTLSDSLDTNALTPPGIVTESGGDISIFTNDSVDIGVGRIFTLRGGDIVIWSTAGDIAAGSSSKTVQSAPPTRVLIDPQSATVETDLAGLATGGGIGVLDTVAGVMPGDVDLIAPSGIIDAGDAGIRVTGNINLAATQVVNASNIAAGGTSTGAPATPTVSAPNIGGLSAASAAAGGATSAATAATADAARSQNSGPVQDESPSLITVEVLGYGGGAVRESRKPEENEERERRERDAAGSVGDPLGN
ncbi:MAG: filamentous hemagglutinin family protein [Verrucomicrobiae bacterium]|nr:filamentous hemagglutinin family protein [Verrucomicrobiae bacterium]